MSYEYLYGLEDTRTEVPYFDRFPSRKESLESLQKKKFFDIVIVGGGVHGAALARLAAFNGLGTLLLEKGDYASATSGRSSKMAHGGLRYLEMGDFRQVFEGIRARDNLFQICPHLVSPHRFQIPVFHRWERLKFQVGLSLYDLFLGDRTLRSQWRDKTDLPTEGFPQCLPGLLGCFDYCDGIMDDSRIVFEMIVSARQEGALCLNYARFDTSRHERDDTVSVGFTDLRSGEKHSLRCGIVVDCAGPWAGGIGRLGGGGHRSASVRWSQGSHLLFPYRWKGPALFLPLPEKTRYYFVWPHPAGTLVGTTERELKELPDDPIPGKDEIDELLARVQNDLSWSPLATLRPHYAFAGVRTLPLRSSSRSTGRLSRRHIWSYGQGILSLLGGKFTTAMWTAEEGLRKVFSLAKVSRSVVSLSGRKLPGGFLTPTTSVELKERFAQRGIPAEVSDRVIRRYGSRAGYFLGSDSDLELVGGLILFGELRLALQVEQAESLDDVMSRRLGLEYLPGGGEEVVVDIAQACRRIRPDFAGDDEVLNYRSRLSRNQALCNRDAIASGH